MLGMPRRDRPERAAQSGPAEAEFIRRCRRMLLGGGFGVRDLGHGLVRLGCDDLVVRIGARDVGL
ncbi:hypothetical protein GCM10009777_27690 [Microbacterium pumilum]|uniref:Uncharacterized protein n=1 Tax=Microbacterium pumilum TaxID=344165 RepID=A0ABP5E4K9_9MICO